MGWSCKRALSGELLDESHLTVNDPLTNNLLMDKTNCSDGNNLWLYGFSTFLLKDMF